MNVLHINSYYFNGEFYKNFYDKQTHLGIGIDVYVPANKNNQKLERSDYGDYTQISYNFNNLDRVSFVLKHKKILADMVKFYNIKRYDLIHAHSLFSNGYIAYKLNEIYGVPYIVAIRNTDVNLFFKKMVHLR